MNYYSADLETTTDPNDCRVWAWAYCNIQSPDNVKIGTELDDLIEEFKNYPGIYYFHNLKFDGNFILYWLFKHNYKWTPERRRLEPGEFTTMISDMGAWYSIIIALKASITGVFNKVEIRDSAKIIPLSVKEIPKAYGLDEAKGEIDYNKKREKGYQLDENERDYIKHDVSIVAKALSFMQDNGQTKLTAASNALHDFKSRYDKKEYSKLFPELNSINDADIRRSYKGGWTYLNPYYRNKPIGEGQVFDVNSMYPWAMRECLLPYGDPVWFNGEYKYNVNYPLYVQAFVAEFKLKPNRFPSIQVKGSKIGYGETEYIEKSLKPTLLVLTSVDFELFKHNYDYDIIEYCDGYMFRAKHGMFNEYIDFWFEQKTKAKAEGNKGLEKLAKLMLNSLYGKFGARKKGKSKIPYYDNEQDKVRYNIPTNDEDRKGGYLPVATFITSYCRDKIIRCAEVCGNRFVYADTDSVHIIGNKPVKGMDVDDYRLGAFKLEERFVRAKFIRQKTYMEITEKDGFEKVNLKCCGMPREMQQTVTEDEFFEGAIYDASENSKFKPKLMPIVVSGGVILKETTFRINKQDHSKDNESIITFLGMED